MYLIQNYQKLLFLSGILIIFLLEYDVLPHLKLGFICKDPKLSHKFKGDTVTPLNLLISGSLGPLAIITIVELLRENTFNKIIRATIWHFYKKCFMGFLLVFVITYVLKSMVQEPRPHFFDSCKPDSNEMCQEGTIIYEFNCANTQLSTSYEGDLTRSFPSGHASISVFIAIYCSYLVQMRIPSNSPARLPKVFLILLCVGWSCLCSLSRIIDRKHHWWDVLVGAFLGMCGAFYTLRRLRQKSQGNPML